MSSPYDSETRKEGSGMKIILIYLLMLVSGVFGLLFILGDCESLLKLALSKPFGLLLLFISYRLHGYLRREYGAINNKDNKFNN